MFDLWVIVRTLGRHNDTYKLFVIKNLLPHELRDASSYHAYNNMIN